MSNDRRNKQILIVEDEVLLAKQIKKDLLKNGYSQVSISTNYEDAVDVLTKNKIDIALLDININGHKSGLEIAKYINSNLQLPFIFLTSYNDEKTLETLLELNPLSYLNKPVNKYTLISNINFHFNSRIEDKSDIISLPIGSKVYQINKSEITHVQAEHVYLNIHYKNSQQLIRYSLSKFLNLFSEKDLIQINRSTAVNYNFIEEYNHSKVKIQQQYFKISEKYSADFLEHFNVKA